MLNTTIDLGQLIIASMIAAVGWFVKREIVNLGIRIDLHDRILFDMSGKVNRLIGAHESIRGTPINWQHQRFDDSKKEEEED